MKNHINIFWFRRDLRLNDNHGLFQALSSNLPVLPIFIFDKNILDQLENKSDHRVQFIHAALTKIQSILTQQETTLDCYYDTPINAFKHLISKYSVANVFTNHDYEGYARGRDTEIENFFKDHKIHFHSFKDQVIFEKDDVIKDDGSPYTVFTPYSKKWKSKLLSNPIVTFPSDAHFSGFLQQSEITIPSLESMGFNQSNSNFPSSEINEEIITKYSEQRDIPSKLGTSRLGVHLRFGTISVRQLAIEAMKYSESFLNELIWRDFYQMICWHFPHINNQKSFKPKYDHIKWVNNEAYFEKWCSGHTGYPIVDAGMRELNATGFMHNRVRMIVASFLCKHLLIDWRWGEAYFAEKLLDYDFASNNGGWQWAAGSGCDAAPYFRIFNPYLQTKKFDPQLLFIKKWVPEFESLQYAQPIVQHEVARKRCLEVYASALK